MIPPNDVPNNAKATASHISTNDEQSPASVRIRGLLMAQSYAVLCTQSQSQPYGSLIAFAASDDLKTIVFATPVATRKYRLLTECENVALVIDSRADCPTDMMRMEAVTATGRARVVGAGTEFDGWAGLLIARHPHLATFVKAQSSALVCVEVVRYLHVGRFQEVRQWEPGSAS
jgi:nitroimidazol reductase NimA-like FMN-containing flavoprotein (pyridoxamine 5'-phosphate oxidase superfamily)